MAERNYFFLAVLVGLVILAFYGVADLGFVWDDKAFLVNDVKIRSADSFGSLFFEPFFISNDYYRPLVVLSYAIQAKFHGLLAEWFHLVNLSIHILNCVLIYYIAKFFVFDKKFRSAPFWVALVFSLHPSVIETVAWISGRFDLLSCFFILSFVLILLRMHSSFLKLVLLYFCFLSAALSKESAAGFALALPIIICFYEKSRGELSWPLFFRKYTPVFLSVFFAGMTYLLLRYFSMGYLLSGGIYNDYGSLFQRVLLSLKAFWVYCGILIFPFFHVSPIHHHEIPIPINDVGGWIALLLSGLTLVVLIATRSRLIWILPFLLLLILPALHIFQTPLQDNLVQERYLYMPLALMVVFFCWFMQRVVIGRTKIFKSFLMLLMFFYIVISFLTVRVTVPLWKDDLTLWTWAASTSPDSKPAKANLAAAYEELGELDSAKKYANEALAIKGRILHDASIYVTLGNIYNKKGEYEIAADFYMKSFDVSRNRPEALVNMANTLIHLGEYGAARWYLELAEENNYIDPLVYINYGMLFSKQGDITLAEIYFNKGLEMMDESKKNTYEKVVKNFL